MGISQVLSPHFLVILYDSEIRRYGKVFFQNCGTPKKDIYISDGDERQRKSTKNSHRARLKTTSKLH